MRRLPLMAAVLLAQPAQALARAGGGSSGFGGGGGGGGGGSSSGGSSGSGDGDWTGLLFLVVLALIFFGGSAIAGWRATRRRKVRVRRTITASAEAAEDDAWFDAGSVQDDAGKLFCEVQVAWDKRDRDRLAALVGDDLMVEWKRRLDDFDLKGWHNHVEVRDGPSVEYVGIVNREDDTGDRVCVRVSGSLFDVVETKGGKRIRRKDDPESDVSSFAEYWTLARSSDHWTVVSIEQDEEGSHNLEDPLIPTPWSDQQRLHDEAVVEQAEAGAANGDAATLYSVEFADDAHKAALDLSVVDDRFGPAVLEAAARAAVAAWAEAVDGDDAALEAVAEPDAIGALLYGGDDSRRTRLVVRDPAVEAVRIVGLDGEAKPARLTIAASVRGRRYVENRDTAAVVSGDPDHDATFTETWELALSDAAGTPWRLTRDVSASAAGR